jgi:hypothetical protein
VHFNEGKANRRQCIPQGDAGVSQRGRIDDDEFEAICHGGLHSINQYALVITLKGYQLGVVAGGHRSQLRVDIGQSLSAIDVWLSLAQQV